MLRGSLKDHRSAAPLRDRVMCFIHSTRHGLSGPRLKSSSKTAARPKEMEPRYILNWAADRLRANLKYRSRALGSLQLPAYKLRESTSSVMTANSVPTRILRVWLSLCGGVWRRAAR